MEEKRHTFLELVLVALGPIGFAIFLIMHAIDSRILKELEEDLKSSRFAHGGIVTVWTIICLVMLSISSGPVPEAPVTVPEIVVSEVETISIEELVIDLRETYDWSGQDVVVSYSDEAIILYYTVPEIQPWETIEIVLERDLFGLAMDIGDAFSECNELKKVRLSLERGDETLKTHVTRQEFEETLDSDSFYSGAQIFKTICDNIQ